MSKTRISLLAVVASLISGCDDAFTFVENGEARCALVESEGLRRVDLDFFTNAVCRCTGALIPIVEKVEAEGGRWNYVSFSVKDAPVLEEDAYEVSFPDAKTMKISGTRDSVRFALNRILEDRFGVVFCLPGRHGTHYPAARTVAMPLTGWKDEPAYKLERDDCGAIDPNWKRALNAKYYERVDTHCHYLRTIFPQEIYGKEPWISKLMPLIKGKREAPKSWVKLWEPCFACEESIDIAVGYIRGLMKREPNRKWVSLGVNDCGGFCECDGCKALNGGSVTAKCRFDRNYTSFSTGYYDWCRKIADRVAKEFPGLMIGMSGYRETIDPPPFKLPSNMSVELCVETLQWVDKDNEKRFTELFNAWSEVCDHVMIYDYAYGDSYKVPRIYNRLLHDYLNRKYTTMPGLNGWTGECGDPWHEGPKFWLHFRLLWNPRVDLDRTLQVWYDACAGREAAPYVKEFYDLFEEFWMGDAVKKTKWYAATCHFVYFWFTWQQYCYAIEPERLEKAERCIDRALAAAERSGTEDQKARMRDLAVWMRQAIASAYSCGAGAVTGPAGELANEADVAFFEKNFPRMQKAELERVKLYDRIGELEAADVADYVDTPKWRAHLKRQFRKLERPGWTQNRMRLVNQYLRYRNGAADPAGANYVTNGTVLAATDCTVAAEGGRWKVTSTGPNPSVSFTAKSDEVKREYFFSVTVKNGTAHAIKFSTKADGWLARANRTSGDEANMSGEAGPGKSATVNSFFCLYRNYFTGDVDLRGEVRFANLKTGESAVIENLAFRVPSERALNLGGKATGRGGVDRDNMTTFEDRQL